MSEHPGKKKLEELVARANAIEVEGGFAASRSISISPDTIRSISDAYKAMEADAARYRWLREDNAYAPEEECVRGGEELDELCDEGIASLKGSRHEG